MCPRLTIATWLTVLGLCCVETATSQPQPPSDVASTIVTSLDLHSLALPYTIDESSIILPPGFFVSDSLQLALLGSISHQWHVWIVGRLQGPDSLVSLVLKFEGGEGDYVDIYLLVVWGSTFSIERIELLAIFAGGRDRETTSTALIDENLQVQSTIRW